MTPQHFVEKWRPVTLPERAASQEHFIDLCRMLGQPTPAEHDATGAEYTFEKVVSVSGPASKGARGERGFADVWWRGKFAWEYKRKDKHTSLAEAYRQLLQYREALENPPLLIVGDITRTEIHTNFTGTAKQIHVVELEQIPEPESLSLLRRVFTDPESFRPNVTADVITEKVAERFATLAQQLRDRHHNPQDAAHFLMKCMFCLFAEDVELLPEKLFERVLRNHRSTPQTLTPALDSLFNSMRHGGSFGAEIIQHFNGGLFDDSRAIDLLPGEIDLLIEAAKQDWSGVEPAIFGTLFERSLDPNTRAQIGAQYTSREDIVLIIEPVVMAPLRREWEEIKGQVLAQLERRAKAKTPATKRKADDAIKKLILGFDERLAHIRILDPACGSGNFLYVAIQHLLDLEKEVLTFASQPEIEAGFLPQVRPTQLFGIEINPYAAELAQVVIWIGYLQWMRDNGFNAPSDPILEPLQTIECRDAILDFSDPAHPAPAQWPESDFIIGNPPFLGSKVFRLKGLEDKYIEAMYESYDLPNTSDLCCYWFEQARHCFETTEHLRVGLLATQGIRGGSNRFVLEKVKKSGEIFMAWADREWILDGAAVHVSIIGFDNGTETSRTLDSIPAESINADLTSSLDLSASVRLIENRDIAFMGDTKVGPFDIPFETARMLFTAPNPNGKANSEVVRPWVNGLDITRRPRSFWIVDFPPGTSHVDAASYEAPFEFISTHVRPMRKTARSGDRTGVSWWIHQRPRPDMRRLIENLSRFVATPNLTKFRIFSFLKSTTLPDHQLIAFARSDDYFFGVLHSAVHELWALRRGTQLEDRPRYTPTTCFETFTMPWPPGDEPANDDVHRRISDAAQMLNEQRERWLNPPEWIEPIAAAIDAEDDFSDVPQAARALIRESAIMAAAAKDPNLKKRTLTNLYNQRPTWLQLAHQRLDQAVIAAYAATDPQGAWDESWSEVWVETGAGQPLPEDHALFARREKVDQHVLASLLRLNQERATRT